MAEIPWWAWLGVGLFVSISAAFTGGQVSLFAWVGLAFVAFGIGKVVLLFVLKPRETKQEQQAMHMPQYPMHQARALYCPQCRITVQPNDSFCKYCGRRLR